MKKLFTFLLAALLSAGLFAESTVTFSKSEMFNVSGNSITKDGVTLTVGRFSRDFAPDVQFENGINFTTTDGAFTNIQIKQIPEAGIIGSVSGEGWDGLIWEGNKTSVSGSFDAIYDIAEVVCTLGETNEYTAIWVNFPKENNPEAIEIIGTFDDWQGTAMEKLDNGWYFVELEASELQYFMFRSAGYWNQVIEIYNTEEDSWFRIRDSQLLFGQFWQDVSWEDKTYKRIDLDFSNPNNYRWSDPYSGYAIIDGLKYSLNGENHTAVLVRNENQSPTGDIIIPDFVSYQSARYKVITISPDVFSDCIDLISVTIGNNVTHIGDNAFARCDELTSVSIGNNVTSIGKEAFTWCRKLTSLTIPNSVTSIGNEAFYYCCSLTSVTIPDSITSIETNVFALCSGLTSVTIPNSVTSIGSRAFYGCSGLTSVTIPNSVTSIGEKAFQCCYNLTSIVWNAVHCKDFKSTSAAPFNEIKSQITSFEFGDYVEYIPAYLCYGMTNVPEIVVKNCHIEIGNNAFFQCNYSIEGLYNIILPDTSLCYYDDLIIDGYKFNLQKKANQLQTWTRNLLTVNACDSIVSISVLWKKIPDFSITTKDVIDTNNSGSISYIIDQSADYKGKYYYTLNGVKNASLYNLSQGNYRLVFYGEECGDSIVKSITINQYGIKVNNQYYLLDDVNHTAILTFRGKSSSDYKNEYSGSIIIPENIKFNGEEYQVTGINSSTFSGCNNITSITMESATPISMYSSGLSNSCTVYVPFGSLSSYKSANGWMNNNIHVINPTHVTTTTGATSASISIGNIDEVQHIISCGIEGGEQEFAGNIIAYTGLEPNRTYSDARLFVKTIEGDSDVLSCSFKTTALELTTKESKAVSSSTALLFAETNMSDVETNCGFEWKRENAPESMAGTKVYCPVASGQMAGRLKNLKDDVYYKYRAFYQSTAGNMYYGDWQYIFTGDVTVEFDPVLYTYTASAITETSAIISGYALAGSEDFTEQGFEYWAESRANNGANALARKPAALGEHVFVKASGINMRVSLTNLDAGTIYKYRAYAKVGDQIYYGSEQNFTTNGTYTPPTYVITFVNWDGTELQSSPVVENTLPEYAGKQPTRPNDEEFSYSFKGWTPEIVIATEDATYTATFEKTILTAISNIETGTSARKVLRDGQIFILRGHKTYTLQGQEVK